MNEQTPEIRDAALAKAYTAFYADVENATKNAKNPHLGNTYANLGAILRAIKPHLKTHRLSILQAPGKLVSIEGVLAVSVVSVVRHEDGGQWAVETQMPMSPKLDKKTGSEKYGAQEAGSAISYARRYALSAICGITQEDDDGHAASAQSDTDDAPEESDLPKLLALIEASDTTATLEALKTKVQEAGDRTVAKAYVAKVRDLKKNV